MEQLLIVEDDRGLNQGLSKALKTDDRQIISCHDLKAAREQLLCGSVSLILLDINLPDGNGLDLLKEIKGKKYYVSFAALLLSYRRCALTHAQRKQSSTPLMLPITAMQTTTAL